jgi:hypothetical protein
MRGRNNYKTRGFNNKRYNFEQINNLEPTIKPHIEPKNQRYEEIPIESTEEEEMYGIEANFSMRRDKKKKMKSKVKSIKVEPIQVDGDSYIEAPHPNLLRQPFSLLVIAPKGGGKSTITINYMKWFKGRFDNTYIFSPTIYNDSSWIVAMEKGIIDEVPEDNITEGYSEFKLKKIWANIKTYNYGKVKQHDKLQTLILFDDIVGELPKAKSNTCFKIARNHRHQGVSSIFISQEYKALDTVIRKNTTGLILLKTDNYKEIEAICEECSGLIGKWRFLRMWVDCISKPYGFFFINRDDKKRTRFFCNFETELNPMNYSNERVRDIVQEFGSLYGAGDNETKEDK